MNEKKKNAFLVHTEYHLLITAAIIAANYSDTEKFENRIYNLFTVRELMSGLQIEFIAKELKLICYDGNPNLKNELKSVFQYRPDNFFYFQEGSPVNYYLVANLFKMGTKIALVQDGLKAYSIVNKKFENITLIRDTFRSYKNLFTIGLPLWKFHLFRNYKYGVTEEITDLWLSHSKSFIKNNKKQIRNIPELSDSNILKTVKNVFSFEKDRYLTKGDNSVIFYINQPFYNVRNINIEYNFLKLLIEKNKNRQAVYIKIHRSTTDYHLGLYKKLPDVTIIYENIPAELLVLSLKNSIILSGWSTTLLTFNNQCNYYYNYPIYEKDILLSQSYPFNPTNYIQVVDNVNEISFPDSI